MNEDFNYLYHYLKLEEISIDKTEFRFQLQSHPEYPSLLSISDTLNFFDIDNTAIRLAFSDINLLPLRFVALLQNEDKKPFLCYIEKKDKDFLILKDNKIEKIDIATLESNWSGIVLLAEKLSKQSSVIPTNKTAIVLPILCGIAFIANLYLFGIKLDTSVFFIFAFLGILLSIAALKDLFGTKSELINNFCNISANTSCESIIDSQKWKILQSFGFSDL